MTAEINCLSLGRFWTVAGNNAHQPGRLGQVRGMSVRGHCLSYGDTFSPLLLERQPAVHRWPGVWKSRFYCSLYKLLTQHGYCTRARCVGLGPPSK